MGVSIVEEKRCGLASMFTWQCRGRYGRPHNFPHRASKTNPSQTNARAGSASSKLSRVQVQENTVNTNATIAMVSLGCGASDLNAFAAHMDVPLSQGFAPSYRKCEEFIGNAIIAVADESQDEACVESAKMARGRAADFASRDAPLPIGDTVMFEGRELTNTVVGFDGGWQRRAIGMDSYNSRSGHASMVCQLIK